MDCSIRGIEGENWLVTQIATMLVMLLTENVHQNMCSRWVKQLSHRTEEATSGEFLTMKVEFIAAATSSHQAMCLRRILEVVGWNQIRPMVIYYNNCLAIKLSKNVVFCGGVRRLIYVFIYWASLQGTK